MVMGGGLCLGVPWLYACVGAVLAVCGGFAGIPAGTVEVLWGVRFYGDGEFGVRW